MSQNVAPPVIPHALLLDYSAATDIANNLALTANTWTDIGTNQSFTVGSANSIIHVQVSGVVNVSPSGSAANQASRLVIDSAGTAILKSLGGNIVAAGVYGNALAGAGVITLTGLAIGTHTVKLQVISGAASVVYCRASSNGLEFLQIRVVEHR